MILVGSGLAAVLIAGGAVALTGGDDPKADTSVAATAAVVVVGTAADEHRVNGVVPAATASTGASSTPGPSRSATSSASATTEPVRTVKRGWRPSSAAPLGGQIGQTGEPEAMLFAYYRYDLDESGYRGTVRVVNSGDGAASDWTVTLDVPGAETVTVTSGPVSVSQSGSAVTFRPSGGPVSAGGTVRFGFTLDGVPVSAPTGCTLDGAACS